MEAPQDIATQLRDFGARIISFIPSLGGQAENRPAHIVIVKEDSIKAHGYKPLPCWDCKQETPNYFVTLKNALTGKTVGLGGGMQLSYQDLHKLADHPDTVHGKLDSKGWREDIEKLKRIVWD